MSGEGTLASPIVANARFGCIWEERATQAALRFCLVQFSRPLLAKTLEEQQTKQSSFDRCGATGCQWDCQYGIGSFEVAQEQENQAEVYGKVKHIRDKWGERIL